MCSRSNGAGLACVCRALGCGTATRGMFDAVVDQSGELVARDGRRQDRRTAAAAAGGRRPGPEPRFRTGPAETARSRRDGAVDPGPDRRSGECAIHQCRQSSGRPVFAKRVSGVVRDGDLAAACSACRTKRGERFRASRVGTGRATIVGTGRATIVGASETRAKRTAPGPGRTGGCGAPSGHAPRSAGCRCATTLRYSATASRRHGGYSSGNGPIAPAASGTAAASRFRTGARSVVAASQRGGRGRAVAGRRQRDDGGVRSRLLDDERDHGGSGEAGRAAPAWVANRHYRLWRRQIGRSGGAGSCPAACRRTRLGRGRGDEGGRRAGQRVADRRRSRGSRCQHTSATIILSQALKGRP